jgi:hypothetical protein
MEVGLEIAAAVVAIFVAFRFLRARSTREAAKQSGSEKKAKAARDSARAVRNSLDGRR